MNENLIKSVEKRHIKENLPIFGPGDTLRVGVKVIEGNKERIQAFEGTCIGRSGSGTGETFIVRRITQGVGVERIFQLHSPRIDAIEVRRRGKVRRAKLFYLRDRIGSKAIRIKERAR